MVHAGDSPLLQSGKILISRSVRLVPLKKTESGPVIAAAAHESFSFGVEAMPEFSR